jgi:hypothetical protein
MASLFAQPYISPTDYDTLKLPSKEEILMEQQSAVNEHERCRKATRRLVKKHRRSKSMLMA